MQNYLKIWGILHEQEDIMTCEFLTNEANATFEKNSSGVAEIITDGYFKDKKVIASCKPTYGTPNEDCCIDAVSQAPNKVTFASTVNGTPQGNIFYNTPFQIWIKIP